MHNVCAKIVGYPGQICRGWVHQQIYLFGTKWFSEGWSWHTAGCNFTSQFTPSLFQVPLFGVFFTAQYRTSNLISIASAPCALLNPPPSSWARRWFRNFTLWETFDDCFPKEEKKTPGACASNRFYGSKYALAINHIVAFKGVYEHLHLRGESLLATTLTSQKLLKWKQERLGGSWKFEFIAEGFGNCCY